MLKAHQIDTVFEQGLSVCPSVSHVVDCDEPITPTDKYSHIWKASPYALAVHTGALPNASQPHLKGQRDLSQEKHVWLSTFFITAFQRGQLARKY